MSTEDFQMIRIDTLQREYNDLQKKNLELEDKLVKVHSCINKYIRLEQTEANRLLLKENINKILENE